MRCELPEFEIDSGIHDKKRAMPLRYSRWKLDGLSLHFVAKIQ